MNSLRLAFAFQASPGARLSPAEKMEAIRESFQESPGGVIELVSFFGWSAAVILAFALFAYVVGKVHRVRSIRSHLEYLRSIPLNRRELGLFRAIAQKVPSTRITGAATNRKVFERAVARFVRAQKDGAERRLALETVLCLRQRIPFEREIRHTRLKLVQGAAVTVERWDRNKLVWESPAYVLRLTHRAVQLGLTKPPKAKKRLHSGAVLKLTLHCHLGVYEAGVRLRGRSNEKQEQILVDLPPIWIPVRAPLRPVSDVVNIELSERFSDDTDADQGPEISGSITAQCRDGVLVQTSARKIRTGEAVRIKNGDFQGLYQCFVELKRTSNSSEYFLARQELYEAKPEAVSPTETHPTEELAAAS